jgi:Uma2 family endonuclease
MSGHDACEPDVGYVAPHRLHLLEQRYMRGAPDIAVEIVSRESHSRDYGEKREIYEQAGVGEYWILDPLRQSTQFLRLHDGRFEPAPLVKDRYFQSEVIPGFWLDVEWLFADELPNDYACLQSILAGPPDA